MNEAWVSLDGRPRRRCSKSLIRLRRFTAETSTKPFSEWNIWGGIKPWLEVIIIIPHWNAVSILLQGRGNWILFSSMLVMLSELLNTKTDHCHHFSGRHSWCLALSLHVSTSDLHALTYRTPRRGTWTSWTRTHCGPRTSSGCSWPCSSCWCRWSKAGWVEKMTVGSRGPRPWWCCSRRRCKGLWCRWQSQFLSEWRKMFLEEITMLKKSV